jgi:Fe2+ transport system protein B
MDNLNTQPLRTNIREILKNKPNINDTEITLDINQLTHEQQIELHEMIKQEQNMHQQQMYQQQMPQQQMHMQQMPQQHMPMQQMPQQQMQQMPQQQMQQMPQQQMQQMPQQQMQQMQQIPQQMSQQQMPLQNVVTNHSITSQISKQFGDDENDDDKNNLMSNKLIKILKTPIFLFILFVLITSPHFASFLQTYLPKFGNNEDGTATTIGIIFKAFLFVVIFSCIDKVVKL